MSDQVEKEPTIDQIYGQNMKVTDTLEEYARKLGRLNRFLPNISDVN
jgi:ribosome-associated translation inhibitor RaiA